MFLSVAVTPVGRPAALSAISAVKPEVRVAVTVSVAGLPGMYEAASNFAASVNGGGGVTARPMDVNVFGGGNGRLACPWLTAARTLAHFVTVLPLMAALP